jgi:outer membrane protein TolC
LAGLADRLDRRQAEQRLLKAQTDLRKEQAKAADLQRELEKMKKLQAEKEPEGEAVPPAKTETVVTNPAAEAEAADRKEEPATGVPEGKT